MESLLLTTYSAREALVIARPSIEALLKSHHTDDAHRGLVVVIADPNEETDQMLAIERFGESHEFERYEKIAVAKALLARRLKLTTRRALQDAAALLQRGDVRYRGGVYECGVAIGASGAKARVDEACSWITLNATCLLMDEFLEAIPDDAPAFLK